MLSLRVRWRLQVKQADEHGILQVGAYAAKVDPRCDKLRLAIGDPRMVGYPLTSDPRLAHTTKSPPFVDPSRWLACTTCTSVPMMSTPLPPLTHRKGSVELIVFRTELTTPVLVGKQPTLTSYSDS